jgi:hypothetical protein
MANPISVCAVCGKPVSLEDCKIDERGHPVHEECYVARMGAMTNNFSEYPTKKVG